MILAWMNAQPLDQSTLHSIANGVERTVTIDPQLLGIHHSLNDISVSDSALAVDNANAFKSILKTKDQNNPLVLASKT